MKSFKFSFLKIITLFRGERFFDRNTDESSFRRSESSVYERRFGFVWRTIKLFRFWKVKGSYFQYKNNYKIENFPHKNTSTVPSWTVRFHFVTVQFNTWPYTLSHLDSSLTPIPRDMTIKFGLMFKDRPDPRTTLGF